jgi:hypothetical protein
LRPEGDIDFYVHVRLGFTKARKEEEAMKKHNYLQKKGFIVLIAILMLSAAAVCDAEEITLTTYYPSPYGVYSEMRLYPKAPPPVATSCDDKQEGLMYYDNVAHALMVCRCKDSTCLFASNYAWTSAAGYWTLSTSGTDLYTNNPSWNVGIGTTGPGTALDLNGAFSMRQMAVPGLSPSGQGRLYFDSASQKFKVSENGAAYVDLLSSGGGGGWTDDGAVVRLTTGTDKVGIGTTSPQFKLEVNAGSYDGLRIISTDAYPALRLDTVFASGSYKNWAIVTNIYNPGDFGILSSSVAGGVPSGIRFLINGYGNVGIGNNLNAGARLQIRGADDLNTSYALITSGASSSDGFFVANSDNVSIGYPTSSGPTDHFQVGEYGFPGFFTKRFGVQRGSNNLYAWGMYQTTWSDRRMKKDIQPQKDMLERIMALKPVTYHWTPEAKLDSKMHYGIIAQEAQGVFPTLVYEDADGHLNFQRDEMQFILIQALKEQQAEIEELKAEMRELKEKCASK